MIELTSMTWFLFFFAITARVQAAFLNQIFNRYILQKARGCHCIAFQDILFFLHYFLITPYFCALQRTWNQKSKQRLSVSILYRIKFRTDEKNALAFHLFCRSYICKRLHGNDCKLIASVIKLFISAVCKCKVHISRAVRVYFIHG